MAIYDTLSEFSPISLAEMDSVKLMDRTDTKFVFHDSKLPGILDLIKDHYRVLEVDGSLISPYETLYFDSENFDFYIRHHNQKLNRYKVRFRKYVNSSLHFFEVKFKTNKDRTIKSRIKRDQINFSITGKEKELFEKITKLKAEDQHPKLWVNYSRITLVSNTFDERLTFDVDLTFKNNDVEKKVDHLVIAEVKQQKASLKSPVIRVLRKQHLRAFSISKYCMGVINLYPHVKLNNFKPKLLIIKKILQSHE